MSLGELERAAAVRVRVRAKNGSVAQCVIEAQAAPRLSSRLTDTSAAWFIHCEGRKAHLWTKVRPSVLGTLVGKSWQLSQSLLNEDTATEKRCKLTLRRHGDIKTLPLTRNQLKINIDVKYR